jgi:hypothetical protein
MIDTFNLFLSAPIELRVIILAVPIAFFFVGRWLYDGVKIDRERDRQASLDIAFKIAKQTEKNNE